MNYTVQIQRRAQKQLGHIAQIDRERIFAAITGLEEDPRPPGCKRLSDRPAWRIRVGAYRVIYEIRDHQIIVLVVAVGNRGDVYKRR